MPDDAPPAKRTKLDHPSLFDQVGKDFLTEKAVGIETFVGKDISPFSAIIKHRFTDFLVWEIGLDGNVLRLNDIHQPTSTAGEQVQDAPVEQPTIDQSLEWPDNANEALSSLIAEETISKLKGFVTEQKLSSKITTESIGDKDKRTSFHKTIRELFKGKLATKAVTNGEEMPIDVTWERSGFNRSVKGPTDHLPPYIYFTMQKTNRDTQDALGHMSYVLHVPNKDFGTCGTKDKRGVTVQKISFKRGKRTIEQLWKDVTGANLRKQNSNSRERGRGRGRGRAPKLNYADAATTRGDRGVRIADLEYGNDPLDLGMLKGNEFLITLRDVQVDSEETINRSLEVVRDIGFINYYGMQRFGSSAVPTHAIGLALLQTDWALAASLILRPRDNDHPDLMEARKQYAAGDTAGALRNIPKWAIAERSLMESYKKMGNSTNHVGALSTIPKNLRLMYVHAYQSYIWNKIASERIDKYGSTQVILNDMVLLDEGEKLPVNESDDAVVDESLSAKLSARVKHITQEDLDANRYTIYDIVLPLPGFNAVYPKNDLGPRYKELLEQDGLDISNLRRKQAEYSLTGSYRKVMMKPGHLEWKTRKYTEINQPLAMPDEDFLVGLGSTPTPSAPPTSTFDNVILPSEEDHNGQYLALQLSLSLPTACYATMLLREVLKMDTASGTQRNLTDAHIATVATQEVSTNGEGAREGTNGDVTAGEVKVPESAEEVQEIKPVAEIGAADEMEVAASS